MTLVTGTVQDLGYDGMEGTLWARPARFRSDGQVVYAPERKPYKVVDGVVSADLAPGPAVLELQVGSHARGTFEVVIPEEDTTLADLLDTVFAWEPAQVSLFVAERKAAELAKTEAETAAGQAVTAAGTATTAAQQTGQDRSHVDQVRALLDETYDESQAGMALPPRLMESELNATYADKTATAAELAALAVQVENAGGDTLVVVVHGSDPHHPRPDTPRRVMWLGSVVPFYRAAGDLVPEVSTAPAPWSPEMLDLIAWHDAADGYTPGATVTQIADKGPSGNHLVTPGGTGTITVDGSTLAHPAFNFDGASSLMSATYPTGMWVGSVAVYMVVRMTNLDALSSVLFDGTTGNLARTWVSSGGRLVSTTGNTVESPGGSVVAGETMIVAATFNEAASSIAKNGTQLATGTHDATSPIRHRLGSNSGGGNFATALIGEVIVARAVTPEQDTDLVAHLKAKWGVA